MAFINIATELGANETSTPIDTVSGTVQVIVSGVFGKSGASGKRANLSLVTSADGTNYVTIPGTCVKEPCSFIMDLALGVYVGAVVAGGDEETLISVDAGALP